MRKLSQVAVLLLLAVMFIVRRFDGSLAHYLHVRFGSLVLAAGAGFAILAWAAARGGRCGAAKAEAAHGHGAPGWALTVVAVAAVLGVCVPPRSLDSSMAVRRGLRVPEGRAKAMGEAAPAPGPIAIAAAPEDAPRPPIRTDPLRDIREGFLFLQDNLFDGVRVRGVPVDLTGFVVRQEGDAANQFTVARFVLVCCVADASALGLPVVWDGGEPPPQDAWVRIRGVLDQDIVQRALAPVVRAESVEPVERPADPYLYPSRAAAASY